MIGKSRDANRQRWNKRIFFIKEFHGSEVCADLVGALLGDFKWSFRYDDYKFVSLKTAGNITTAHMGLNDLAQNI